MNGRRGFDRPENWTAVIPLLLLLHLDSTSCWSLTNQGLALSEFGESVVRDALGALKDWNNLGGETRACSWLGFGCYYDDDKDPSVDSADPGDFAYRRLLQGSPAARPQSGAKRTKAPANSRSRSSSSPFNGNSLSPWPNSPSPAPSPSPLSKPVRDVPLAVNRPVVVPVPQESRPPALPRASSTRRQNLVPVLSGVLGGVFLLLILAIGVALFRSNGVVTVKPWATGLSGQLQKALVTGVPKLNRSEIVVACEDFSNIIGSTSEGTVYKGTLSSGVEIAVTSSAVKSRQDWSKTSEEQFRKKIEKLSKVNHKNFVNLIGFCEEEEPFTRVMVFEYAPNGTLFEHLHIKEAEHLDWDTRLRIAMGMAYCLEHMHQLSPPIALRDLHSSSVYLTEDYAAKISDFRFWNEVTAAKMGSASEQPLDAPPADPQSNVFSFGAILLEMITGRIAMDWASESFKAECSLREMVDPTLKSFNEEELVRLFKVIRDCLETDPKERPTMVEVAARLKEITAVGPVGATPKLSPLWWAELEIVSSDGS